MKQIVLNAPTTKSPRATDVVQIALVIEVVDPITQAKSNMHRLVGTFDATELTALKTAIDTKLAELVAGN